MTTKCLLILCVYKSIEKDSSKNSLTHKIDLMLRLTSVSSRYKCCHAYAMNVKNWLESTGATNPIIEERNILMLK